MHHDHHFVTRTAILRTLSRAGSGHVGVPGRLIFWCPLKPMFFKLFRPKTGLAKFLGGARPNLRIIFGDIISRVET